MDGGRRLVGLVLAATLAVLGLVAAYVRVELAEPEAFADRGVNALRSDPVRSVIAEQVAVELLERRSPDLVATRPLVLTAVEAVLETKSFDRVLRQAAITAHGVLLEGDEDVAVELGELREVVLPALRSASPELAAQVPEDFSARVAEIRATDAATATIRLAEQARIVAWPLLASALLALVALVTTAADRRQAASRAGIAVAATGGLGVLALAALEAQAVSHAGQVGVVSEEQARAAARATWDALAADLQRLLLVFAGTGLAVWASGLLATIRLDREAAVARVADVLAGELPSRGRFARGLGLSVLGALVLLQVDPLFEIVAVGFGGVLVLLGLTEAVASLRTVRRARAVRAPTPDPRPRRRRLLLGGGAALAVAAGAAAALVLPGGPPAPLADEELTTCNGSAALCDRRLDRVALAGTHNSMSAADRPGWLFANQTRPVPRQLDDGVRLLMLDPHYGIVNREGRIRTDLSAEGTTRNRVARQLGVDAVGAAERLAGRLGLVPDEGKRRIYLCHTLCELGAERFSSTLGELRGWLERNRSEVLVVLLESSVDPGDVQEAVEEAELEPYLATLPRSGPLPRLRDMITSGRRLVLLDERDGGSAPWYQPAFLLFQGTSIDAFTRSSRSCAPGRGSPDNRLLIANHWVDRFPPPVSAAERRNRAGVLRARIESCRTRLGRTPNAIAVDFYERGELLRVVRELNR